MGTGVQDSQNGETYRNVKKLAPEFDANVLKLIAIAAMTVDHLTWMLFPGYAKEPLPVFLHIIGRLTCPIMCFFIAEGFHYTHDIKKYTGRLFLFAGVSHVPYILASENYVDWKSFLPFYYGDVLNQTSVMWALAWGLVMLRIAESSRIRAAWKPVLVVLACAAALPSDWSCIASLCVLSIGTNRGNAKKQILWCLFYIALYAGVYCLALDPLYGVLQFGVVLSIPLLFFYNGTRGKNARINRVMKWLFYLYYPLHLLVIGLIMQFVLK